MLCAYVIADIILVINMFLLCEIFLRLRKKKWIYNKAIWLVASVFMVVVSLLIHLWDHDIIETIIYVLAICLLMFVFYKEKVFTIFFSTVWVIVIMGMLDTMSIVLIEMMSNFTGTINDGVSRVSRTVILCIFLLIFGKLYNKKYNYGIRTIGAASLIAFTILTIIDTFIVMVIARITINEEQRQY